MNEYHAEHALEAAQERRLTRVREQEAETRRLDEERHQRRIRVLMQADVVLESGDFWGAVL